MSKPKFEEIDIYPVTNRRLFLGRYTHEGMIAALAEGGAKVVQLREKDLDSRDLYELATLYRKETNRYNMLLIIDDRLDVAMAVNADGVHLGRTDLPVPAARNIIGESFIIGASSHDVAEAKEAEGEGASYVNVGPAFITPTKPDVEPTGLGPIKECVDQLKIPVTTMGGIVEENLDQVLATGIRHVGVITAIFAEEDIASATRNFVNRIK